MVTEVGSFEAKTHFSDLLRRVDRNGERFIVTVRGKPVASLGPVEKPKLTAEGLEALLEELEVLSKKVASRGPLLKPGETLKDFAREGLR
jgi:prevent-host-death family protein